MKTTGAELIMRLLERQGITTIAGIPGGANLPLYDALRGSRIRHVLARHEQGAGFIAQGMARATGRPAVCFGTSGPGATNLLTAIADAKLDSIPLVAITGQVPRAMIGTDAFQEIDTYGLTVPITKHNFLVRSAAELLEVIPDAFRIAASGRPGPVVVDVPKDVQNETIDVDALPEPGRADPPPRCGDDDVGARRRADRRGASGRCCWSAPASSRRAPATRCAGSSRRRRIPVAATLLGLGALPHDHPLFLGMVGMHAARCTNLLLEECDLLVGLGVRFDDRATGKAAEFCPRAKIIHVDIDPSELGKIKQPCLGIEADVGEALRALEPRVAPAPRAEWIDARRRRCAPRIRSRCPAPTIRCEPYGIIRHAAALLPPTTRSSPPTSASTRCGWRRRIRSRGRASGSPRAASARWASACRPRSARRSPCPSGTVVCFSGDGSLLMNIQELATAAEEGVERQGRSCSTTPTSASSASSSSSSTAAATTPRASTPSPTSPRSRAASASPRCDLGSADDPLATLAARAAPSRARASINVPIAAEENVYPMVPPGGANRDMIGGETPCSRCN